MGNSNKSQQNQPTQKAWGAVLRGILAVGPSIDSPSKTVLVQTDELLPHNPLFAFEISKSQSQWCKSKFRFHVELKGPKEFQLVVTCIDKNGRWEQDLHLRWKAEGGTPIAEVPSTVSFDEEVAQMVAMGFDPESARQALCFRNGDLGAAISFVGAVEAAEQMPADVAPRPDVDPSSALAAMSEKPIEMKTRSVSETERVSSDYPEPQFAGLLSGSAASSTSGSVKASGPLASTESLVEPEPLAGWSSSTSGHGGYVAQANDPTRLDPNSSTSPELGSQRMPLSSPLASAESLLEPEPLSGWNCGVKGQAPYWKSNEAVEN